MGAEVKKILLLLLAVFSPFVCFAAERSTFLAITEDRQWQGQVVLEQPILVAVGATLTIAPGTRIRTTEKEFLIRVEGTLQALGSATQPIIFDTPRGWQGIELYQSAELSRFDFVRITAAAVGLSSSLSRFEVKQSRFQDCSTAIKLNRQSTALIVDSTFNANQLAVGIGMRSQVVLRGNRFRGNKTAVMASRNSSGELTDNYFGENQQGVYLRNLFAGKLMKNSFINNATAILCDQTMASPLIEGNRFESNQQGVVCLLASKPHLRYNVFQDNQLALVNNQLGSPHVEQNLFLRNLIAIKNERRSAPLVERNRFEKNKLALLCDYLSYPTVRQNNFIANHLAVKLGDHQSADMEKQGSSTAQRQKTLAASGRPGKLAVFGPAAGVVDVRQNWWGRELTEAEPQLFFSRQQAKWVIDDISGEPYLRDRITYSPWLQTPVADAGIQLTTYGGTDGKSHETGVETGDSDR
ncbi:MAG: hypothetical protein GXP51_01345 [Deltaproteobacteria bacterium]|nr:hypothetical protein [Deltaproteobacteria bacterium]